MEKARLTPSIEDYMKAIYNISQTNKVVRVKDLAKYLHVKMPSVVNAVRNLESKGLVIHENYGYIELTEAGEKIGKSLKERHNILTEFLVRVLQIDKRIAAEDACAIEHYLNPLTVQRVIDLLEFLKKNPRENVWIEKFRSFLSDKERSVDRSE